jgi:hypothetical protein
LREHLPDLVLHAEPDTLEVDRQDSVEVLFLHVNKAGLVFDAGVVVGEVEPAESGYAFRDEVLLIRRTRHVSGDELGRAAARADHVDGAFGLSSARDQVGDQYGTALLGESHGTGTAYAAGGAGDDPRPAVEPAGHARTPRTPSAWTWMNSSRLPSGSAAYAYRTAGCRAGPGGTTTEAPAARICW